MAQIHIHPRIAVLFLILSAIFAVGKPLKADERNTIALKTIVIDAGHGGKDPGCISADGKTKEKDITLDVALKFGNLIKENVPGVKVVFTRTKDVYLTLDERAQVANRNKADLFLSIHVNACDSKSPHGYSSHILGESSNKNRDTFAGNLNVCKRENSVILLEDDYSTKYEGFNPDDPESSIFFKLMQNAFYEQSLTFAATINDNMGISGPVSYCRGISQDPFYVLWKTTMPAVLFEMAFMSNLSDLAILRTEEGRASIAASLLNAFVAFKAQYDSSVNTSGTATSSNQSSASAQSKASGNQSTASANTGTGASVADNTPDRYGIIVSTSSRNLPANDSFFKKRPVTIYKDGNLYRYVVEECEDIERVTSLLPEVSAQFPGCYIVRIDDGKPVRYTK